MTDFAHIVQYVIITGGTHTEELFGNALVPKSAFDLIIRNYLLR